MSEIYKKYITNFDHVIAGSRALELHFKEKNLKFYREPTDYDILVKNLDFFYNFFNQEKEELKININGQGNEYDGLHYFSITDENKNKIDFFQNPCEHFDLINNLKVAKLQSIVETKNNILQLELKKRSESVDIEKVKKHYFDLIEIKKKCKF